MVYALVLAPTTVLTTVSKLRILPLFRCAHGRSWRILRPKEFEDKVIPAFFEHTKFSSFIRQANGWGFRRVIQGRDRGRLVFE